MHFVRCGIRCVAVSASLIVAQATKAQVSFTDIGARVSSSGTDTQSSSEAVSVSADGSVVVGHGSSIESQGDGRVFRWSAATGVEWLTEPDGYAYAYPYQVSSDGSVIMGTFSATDFGYETRGFRWTRQTGMVDLGTWDHRGADYSSLYVDEMSADGSVIVGEIYYTYYSGGEVRYEYRLFRWHATTGIVVLDLLPGDTSVDDVRLSADGAVICGSSIHYDTDGKPHSRAFRWTAATGMHSLGVLSSLGDTDSAAVALSADGSVIVGWSGTMSPDASGDPTSGHAIRWTASTGMTSLGSLPGVTLAAAVAISADGKTIGVSTGGLYVDYDGYGSSDSTPVIAYRWTQAAGFVKLTPLSGFVASGICDISSDGSVIAGVLATANDPSTGQRTTRAFRWTSAGMVLLGARPGCAVTEPYDLSADGSTVVGYTARDAWSVGNTSLAFRWTSATGLASIAEPPNIQYSDTRLWGMSWNGKVLFGDTGDGPGGPDYSRPFRWDSSSGLTDVALPQGASSGGVYCSSDDGSVLALAAFAYDPDTWSDNQTTYRWTSAGMTSIGTLGSRSSTEAWAMNSSGSVIVGSCYDWSGSGQVNERAFRWNNGVMAELPTPAGMDSTEAHFVSADGNVAFGDAFAASNPDSKCRAVRWSGGAVTELGVLPGHDCSKCYLINRAGTVAVCLSWNSITGDTKVYRWANGAISHSEVPPALAEDGAAVAMSDDGSIIVGYMSYWDDATSQMQFRALRWTASTGIQDIGDFIPTSMTSNGSVIAGARDYLEGAQENGSAVIWTAQRGLVELRTLLG